MVVLDLFIFILLYSAPTTGERVRLRSEIVFQQSSVLAFILMKHESFHDRAVFDSNKIRCNLQSVGCWHKFVWISELQNL